MILCAGAGVPFVGISLSDKFRDLAHRMNMSDYLISVDDIDAGKIFMLADRALETRVQLHEKVVLAAEQLAETSRESITLLSSWIKNHGYQGEIHV